ncbi:MAG: hypothetical protein M1438_06855 [Deltaproteobacteria bacterium]|nr:hypothetical protein [Deltaproteobacteria bacterium]
MISRSPEKVIKLHLVFILLLANACLIFAAPKPAWSQQIFQTRQSAIYYQNPAELREMEERLDFVPASDFSQRYFFAQDPLQTVFAPTLAVKVDGLLARVCLLLHRWPQDQRLRIFLLQDGRQVLQRQLALQPFRREPFFFGYGSLEGFYEPRTRSIFLSLADLRKGTLAHEMAHHVLCAASAIPPPEDLQEEWARYVENHLD